jgi:hypothetical protein
MVQEMSRAQVTLAAKIDSALISQTMAQQSFAQQVADLRHDMTDHEARLRAQEARIYVTPRGMWTGIGVIIAALAALFGLVQLILSAT